MNEKNNGNEFADMEIQELTDNDLMAVAGGYFNNCKYGTYCVVDGQGLMFCTETGMYHSLHKIPCGTCVYNAKG